jgi:hypothetical protein
MDRLAQAKLERQAQERLERAALDLARLAGMEDAAQAALSVQAPPALRSLRRLEALAGVLETVAARFAAAESEPAGGETAVSSSSFAGEPEISRPAPRKGKS